MMGEAAGLAGRCHRHGVSDRNLNSVSQLQEVCNSKTTMAGTWEERGMMASILRLHGGCRGRLEGTTDFTPALCLT